MKFNILSMHARTHRNANSYRNANVVEISFTKEVSFFCYASLTRFVRCFVAWNAWVARGSRGVCFMHSIIACFCAHTTNKSPRSWEWEEVEPQQHEKRVMENEISVSRKNSNTVAVSCTRRAELCRAHVPIATETRTTKENDKKNKEKPCKRGKEDKIPKQQQPLT